jgi:hypothetical protein
MGAKNSIQNAGVNYILSTVVDALIDNPERTFTYVEQAFFSRWWNEQTPAKQSAVRGLVAPGQLVFANGGYCMRELYVGLIHKPCFELVACCMQTTKKAPIGSQW